MIAYVDSSVLLRLVLAQPGLLKEWAQVDHGVTSALSRVEGLRALDRLRVTGVVTDAQVAAARGRLLDLLSRLESLEITPPVLDRASQAFPTALGTLDAIHLSSALLWRESRGDDLTLATHDSALALAAQASGLKVIGV